MAEIIHLSQLFPRFLTPKDNQDIMEEVLEDELKETLQSFQREKFQGPYAIYVEFYLDLFEFKGPDVLRVLEEFQVNGRIQSPFQLHHYNNDS